jgi:hypothetical protein
LDLESKKDMQVWTELIWLTVGRGGGLLWARQWICWLNTRREVHWSDERLLASQATQLPAVRVYSYARRERFTKGDSLFSVCLLWN